MANVVVVVSFFFGLFVYIGSNVDAVIGRALFCRDPDTGKLHPPNTTWPSTTFCGNYTCKIRKRNSTDTRHLEATEVHVNESDNKLQEHAPNTLDQQVEVPSPKADATIDNRNQYDKDYKIAQIEKAIKNGDRYLTEGEIKALSNLLHTVKKSDLEAIIDIYNLAQDIYNEMNRSTIDDILTDHARLRNFSGHIQPDDVIARKHSYWYEPLRNGMLKEATDTIPFVPTIASKVEHLTKRYPVYPNILSNQDFRQLPYYQSDYSSRLYNLYQQLHQKGQQAQVQAQLSQLNELPVRPIVPFQIITTPNYQDPFWVKKRASLQKLKLIQPSFLGAGPLHAFRGNVANSPKVFYYGVEVQDKAIPSATPLPVQPLMQQLVPGPGPIPMSQQIPGPNYAQSYRQSPTNEAPIITPPIQVKGQVPPPRRHQYSLQKPLSKAVLENPYLHDDVRAFEQQQVIHPKRSNILQQLLRQEASSREIVTSMPNSVITEIRSNVLEPPKPMVSQYRKLSLRRVGRLVNLKDLFRIKRQIDNKDMSTDEEFEAYVERKTCDLDMYPGFFRKGNESEVFPRCCPQRIQKR